MAVPVLRVIQYDPEKFTIRAEARAFTYPWEDFLA